MKTPNPCPTVFRPDFRNNKGVDSASNLRRTGCAPGFQQWRGASNRTSIGSERREQICGHWVCSSWVFAFKGGHTLGMHFALWNCQWEHAWKHGMLALAQVLALAHNYSSFGGTDLLFKCSKSLKMDSSEFLNVQNVTDLAWRIEFLPIGFFPGASGDWNRSVICEGNWRLLRCGNCASNFYCKLRNLRYRI